MCGRDDGAGVVHGAAAAVAEAADDAAELRRDSIRFQRALDQFSKLSTKAAKE